MKNLAGALIKAQKEMRPLLKDTKGNFGKYATLASVQEVCLPALGNAGVAVFQTIFTDWEDGRVFVRVVCTLFHAESGENLVDEIALVPTKTDPQGIGSAITYGRRYLLMAMAGIAPEDDDGQAASGGRVEAPSRQNVQPQRAQKTQPQPKTTSAENETSDEENQANQIIAAWKAPGDAMTWAVDNRHTDNEHSARNRFKQIVDADFAGKFTTSNQADVFRAYAAHYLNKAKQAVLEAA